VNVTSGTEVIGAQISGVDLSKKPDAQLVNEIDRLLETYGVLVFRKQRFTPEQQVEFTAAFGPLARSPRMDGRVNGQPDVFAVGNTNGQRILFCPEEPDGELEWHTDQIHRKAPSRATLLYALIIPPKGEETHYLRARTRHIKGLIKKLSKCAKD